MYKLEKLTRLYDLQNKNSAKIEEISNIEGRLNKSRPNVINSFNLFQTPEEIALKMISFVETKGKKILEPSAGLGRLIKNIKDAESITAIDNSKDCIKFLYENFQNIKLIEGDFLKLELQNFELAIMNPPFKNALDIKHILKAMEICQEVVFLAYAGPRQERILKPLCSHWELLPSGSFKESGTNAGVFLGYFTKR